MLKFFRVKSGADEEGAEPPEKELPKCKNKIIMFITKRVIFWKTL